MAVPTVSASSTFTGTFAAVAGLKSASEFVPSGGWPPFQLAASCQSPPAVTLVQTVAAASVGEIVTFTVRMPAWTPLVTFSFT